MCLHAFRFAAAGLGGMESSDWLAAAAHMRAALDGLMTGVMTFDAGLDVLFTNGRAADMLAT